MRIGVPKECLDNETRVSATPKTVKQLVKLGFSVAIEDGAGKLANFDNESYIESGAMILKNLDVWKSDIILKVNPPEENEIALLSAGKTLISFFHPGKNSELMVKLSERGVTVISMNFVPRISRTQSFDALSSMANITGYRAVLEAAYEFGRSFNGQITAAGKIPPAKVMVIGAGVAGLSAIGTANSLGAIVRAFDNRMEVKDQVQSMGAEFLELDFKKINDSTSEHVYVTSKEFLNAEKDFFSVQSRKVDIIITTASIPGKSAPVLITRETVESMQPGSVIVDTAVSEGGNCEYTIADKVVVTKNGVKVIGYTNLPSRLPMQASQLYSTNLVNLMKILCKSKDGSITIDFDDAVMRNITIVHNGNISFSDPLIQTAPQRTLIKKEDSIPKKSEKFAFSWHKVALIILTIIIVGYLSYLAPKKFLDHVILFILSCISGYYVVWNVSNALHTPLMSVTNAISGIIFVGAILQIKHGGWISALSLVAILVSSINIFGGFVITHRMLKMFYKR